MGSCSSKQKSGDDYEDALRDALQKARIEVKKQTNHATLIKKDLAKMRSKVCLLYTSPSPRDATLSRMPSSA